MFRGVNGACGNGWLLDWRRCGSNDIRHWNRQVRGWQSCYLRLIRRDQLSDDRGLIRDRFAGRVGRIARRCRHHRLCTAARTDCPTRTFAARPKIFAKMLDESAPVVMAVTVETE